MRLLGFDCETTGFDVNNDRITEVGAVLWDTETHAPILCYSSFMYDKSYDEKFTLDTIDMMKRVCGITPDMLKEFGNDPHLVLMGLDMLSSKADYIVAHNGNNYDKPILTSEAIRNEHGTDSYITKPWIDTRFDLPMDTAPDSTKLKYMAADAGFVNPFAHRALFDVLTMMKILDQYDINKVIEFSKTPTKVMRAVTSYDQRELAKAQRYSWEKISDKVFPKCWVKLVKENKVQEEIEICKKAGFQSVVIQ